MNEKIFFSPTNVDPSTLLYFLIGLVVFIVVLSVGIYRYRRFKLFQEFNQEMTLLELGQDEESTLTRIVKRYSLKEPVSVLFSLRLFDELASKEIARVLGSPGSASQKQEFINIVYEIRKKTYFQALDQNLGKNLGPILSPNLEKSPKDPKSSSLAMAASFKKKAASV